MPRELVVARRRRLRGVSDALRRDGRRHVGGLSDSRDDPCSCDGGEGDRCADGLGKDGMNAGVCCALAAARAPTSSAAPALRITRVVLHNGNLTGRLPEVMLLIRRVFVGVYQNKTV